MTKMLFLYTELADYVLNCLDLAQQKYELQVVHWPVNPEAPFQLPAKNWLHNKQSFSSKELRDFCEKYEPNFIFVSGWVDKDYLNICRLYSPKCEIVLCTDNQWNGSLRQHLASFLFPLKYNKTFHKAWVSGEKQKTFAKKMGFNEADIYTGFYAAKTDFFNAIYNERQLQKKSPKKVLLYLGRYVKHKGVFELWQAFTGLSESFPDWELWCVGTGDQWNNKVEHPKIKHFGFLQPKASKEIISQATAYVLPSSFEPWGVSVHEMAAAGLPLLLSEAVGSKEIFLHENQNGFSFKPDGHESLMAQMQRLFLLSDQQIKDFSEKSHSLAQKITPQTWRQTLEKIIQAPN